MVHRNKLILGTLGGLAWALAAPGAQADVLFVSNINGTVSAVTPSGSVSPFASGFIEPAGLAFNASGDLFVSTGNGIVDKVTPSGVVSTFASGFDEPSGLTFRPEITSVPTPSGLLLGMIGALCLAGYGGHRRKLAAA
jgi:hypothetical protein